MATKRNLYHPSPKTNVGQRKTRRPLIQGRLVTDSAYGSDTSPSLAQGVSVDDDALDPTITPKKSVPVLTENTSPRPEPPSRCLDLSDADFDNGSELSELSRQQPVMVFDASHLGSSPNSREVEVLVAYEDSPARVICHTPGKLEQSFRDAERKRSNESPGPDGDVPHWSVRVDQVPKVGSLSKSGGRNLFPEKQDREKAEKMKRYEEDEENEHYISHHSRGIIEEILVQEMGVSNVDAISLHSQGSTPSPLRISKASSQSGKSQLQSDHIPSSKVSRHQESSLPFSSINESDKVKSDNRNNSRSQSPRSSAHGKNRGKNVNFQSKISSYPQPKFDDDSDASTDRIPTKGKNQQQPSRFAEETSDSETCSLYEYVTPKKVQEKQVTKKTPSSKTTEPEKKRPDSAASAGAPSSTRKKKMTRVVSSRYMQSAGNKTGNQSSSMHGSLKNQSSEPSFNQPAPKSTENTSRPTSRQGRDNAGLLKNREKTLKGSKSDLRSSRSNLTKSSDNKNAKMTRERATKPVADKTSRIQTQPQTVQNFTINESPHALIQGSEFSSNEQSDRKTSTPTHDQVSHFPHDIDASAIQSVSTMSMNISTASSVNHPGMFQEEKGDDHPNQVPDSKHLCSKTAPRAGKENSQSSGPTELQLDLEYTRYLQWAFLNSKAKKIFQEQEKEAIAQLHGLWELVESKREDNTKLSMEVERLKRVNLVDSVLEKTENELESVASILPQLGEDYTRLSSALDTTRHQLPTKDIFMPQGGEGEREEYEDRLENALRESEQLLAEIGSLSGEKSLPLSQYLDCITAIDKNVSATSGELRKCQKDLENVQGLSTRLSSLYVQDMQTVELEDKL